VIILYSKIHLWYHHANVCVAKTVWGIMCVMLLKDTTRFRNV